jgi:hypothetical protein
MPREVKQVLAKKIVEAKQVFAKRLDSGWFAEWSIDAKGVAETIVIEHGTWSSKGKGAIHIEFKKDSVKIDDTYLSGGAVAYFFSSLQEVLRDTALTGEDITNFKVNVTRQLLKAMKRDIEKTPDSYELKASGS